MPKIPRTAAALDRFFAKVVVEAHPSSTVPGMTPCWWWIGARTTGGEGRDGKGRNSGAEPYGAFRDEGKLHRAHKWIYEKVVLRGGKLPKARDLGHRCLHTLCVNYNHTFPCTKRANVRERNERYDYSRRRQPRKRRAAVAAEAAA